MAPMTGYAESGLEFPKFVRTRGSDGFWFNFSSEDWEVYDSGSIADYALDGVEAGVTGVYSAADPDPDTPGSYLLLAADAEDLTEADVTDNVRWQGEAGDVTTMSVVNANVVKVNGVTIGGQGTPQSPWGPA